MHTICFISLGCPKNQVDSEIMIGGLAEDGYVVSDNPATSDIIIVNTCAFIEDAKTESIDTILEMAAFKKAGSCRMLIVAGCLPQRYKKDLARSMPEVDLFVGIGELARLADLIRAHDGAQRMAVCKPNGAYDEHAPRRRIGRAHAAYIKIAEGCFHACSFCIIPRIRGNYRSRPMALIVDEARKLLDEGVREINLIAQDTTAYGRDLKEDVDLGLLLHKLATLSGEKWIRMLYAYPHDFPESVIAAMRDHRDIVKYVDIPVQHASASVLASMRRKGSADEYARLIDRLRIEIPGISIRTSVIVGYPGETEDDFAELMDFVCAMKFDHLGAFVYSPEEDTAAFRLKKQVPRVLAADRLDELMRVQQEISYDKNRSMIGRMKEVLIEGVCEESEHLVVARHAGQAPDVDGVVYISEGLARAGEFAVVEITHAHEYDLVGRLL